MAGGSLIEVEIEVTCLPSAAALDNTGTSTVVITRESGN